MEIARTLLVFALSPTTRISTIRTGPVEILETDAAEPDKVDPAGHDDVQYSRLETQWVRLIGQRKWQHLLKPMFFVAALLSNTLCFTGRTSASSTPMTSSTGAWVLIATNAIKITLAEDWQRFVRENKEKQG